MGVRIFREEGCGTESTITQRFDCLSTKIGDDTRLVAGMSLDLSEGAVQIIGENIIRRSKYLPRSYLTVKVDVLTHPDCPAPTPAGRAARAGRSGWSVLVGSCRGRRHANIDPTTTATGRGSGNCTKPLTRREPHEAPARGQIIEHGRGRQPCASRPLF